MESHMRTLDKANSCLDAGEFSGARELFSGIARNSSAAPAVRSQACVGYVRSLIGLGEYDEASGVIEKVLAGQERRVHSDCFPSILHERARLAALMGDRHQAVSYFREELLRLSSSMPHYFERLAENYIQQGMVFLELGDRKECDIYWRLARDYADTGKSDKAFAGVLTLKGVCLTEDGAFEEAFDVLCRARDLYASLGFSHASASVEARIANTRRRTGDRTHG